jgi:hypothetical protein
VDGIDPDAVRGERQGQVVGEPGDAPLGVGVPGGTGRIGCSGHHRGHGPGNARLDRGGQPCAVADVGHPGDDPAVELTDQNHSYEDLDVPIGRQFPVNRPVSIGSGTWLGAGAIVLPGAQIGRHVVIAAGSVVRGVIPDRCVVAGVPARVIREHTDAGWLSPKAPA